MRPKQAKAGTEEQCGVCVCVCLYVIVLLFVERSLRVHWHGWNESKSGLFDRKCCVRVRVSAAN